MTQALTPAFILGCIALYIAVNALPEYYFAPMNRHTARMLGSILNLLGFPVSVWGDRVAGEGLAVKIIAECTPVFMWGLFLSFVLFYPAPPARKLLALGAGIPVLYAGNLVRLVAVFLAGRRDRVLFEVLHVYLGQVFTLSLIFLCCFQWLKWVDRDGSRRILSMGVAGFLARLAVISLLLFFLWLPLNTSYIRLVDRVMGFFFFFLGYRLITPIERLIYYETFNIVAFASLVLATRSVPPKRKIKSLFAGLGILFLIHLFYRTSNLMVTGFQLYPLMTAMLVSAAIGQYLLPILLWLRMGGAKLRPARTGESEKRGRPEKNHGTKTEAHGLFAFKKYFIKLTSLFNTNVTPSC